MSYSTSGASSKIEEVLDRYLTWISAVAIGSFFVFYVLAPWAYDFGPALLLLLMLLCAGFQWRTIGDSVDHDSLWMAGAFALYFLSQVSVLLVHGEDLSEFDLSFRFMAAILVLLFLLANPIPASLLFAFAGVGGILTGGHALYGAIFQEAVRMQAFDNAIHYGNGAMALSCLCLAGGSWALQERRRGFWLGLSVLGVVGGLMASLLSGTRSGWIALPVLVVVVLVTHRNQGRSMLLFLVVILMTTLLFAWFAPFDIIERRMHQAGDEVALYFEEGINNTSVGLRLDMYKVGWAAFTNGPLLGIGPSGVEATTETMVRAGDVNPRVADFRHLHNQYIDNMARYGLVGLVAYSVLLLVPFSLFIRKTRSGIPAVRSLALAGSLFVSLHAFVNLTQSMLERNIGVMMFLFVIVFIWATLKREEQLAKRPYGPVASTV